MLASNKICEHYTMKRLDQTYNSIQDFIADLADTCSGTDRVMLFTAEINDPQFNLQQEAQKLINCTKTRLERILPHEKLSIASQYESMRYEDLQESKEHYYGSEKYCTFSTYCCVINNREGIEQNIPYYLEIDVLYDIEEASPVAVRAYLEVCSAIKDSACRTQYEFTTRYNDYINTEDAVNALKASIANAAVHYVTQAINVTTDCPFAISQADSDSYKSHAL